MPLSAEDLRDPNDMNDEYGEVYQPEPYQEPKGKQYKVKKGDSFWRIAQQQMGGGSLMDQLAAANNKGLGAVIHPGDVLNIPEVQAVSQMRTQGGPKPPGASTKVAASKLGNLNDAMDFAKQSGMGKVDAGMEPSAVSATSLANAPKELLQGIGAGVMQVPATALRAGTAAGIVPKGPLSLTDLMDGGSPRDRLQGFLDRTAQPPDSIAGKTGAAAERAAEFALLPGSGMLRNVGVGAVGALAHGGDIEDAGIEGLLAGGLPWLGGKILGGAKKLFGKGVPATAMNAPVGAASKPGLLSLDDLRRLEGGAPGGPLMPRPSGALTVPGQASPVGQRAIEGRVPKLLTGSEPPPAALSVEDLLEANVSPTSKDWWASDIGGAARASAKKAPPAKKAPTKTARKYSGKKEDK